MFYARRVSIPDIKNKIAREYREEMECVLYEYTPVPAYGHMKELPRWEVIGVVCEDDKTKMYPNELYLQCFPAGTKGMPRKPYRARALKAGPYAAVHKIMHESGLWDLLAEHFGQHAGDIADLATFLATTKKSETYKVSPAGEQFLRSEYEVYACSHPLFAAGHRPMTDNAYMALPSEISAENIQAFVQDWSDRYYRNEKLCIYTDQTNAERRDTDKDRRYACGSAKTPPIQPAENIMVAVRETDGEPVFYSMAGRLHECPEDYCWASLDSSMYCKGMALCAKAGFCAPTYVTCNYRNVYILQIMGSSAGTAGVTSTDGADSATGTDSTNDAAADTASATFTGTASSADTNKTCLISGPQKYIAGKTDWRDTDPDIVDAVRGRFENSQKNMLWDGRTLGISRRGEYVCINGGWANSASDGDAYSTAYGAADRAAGGAADSAAKGSEDGRKGYWHVYYRPDRMLDERIQLESEIAERNTYYCDHIGGVCPDDPHFILETEMIDGQGILMDYRKNIDKIAQDIAMCGYDCIYSSEKMAAQEALAQYRRMQSASRILRSDRLFPDDSDERLYPDENGDCDSGNADANARASGMADGRTNGSASVQGNASGNTIEVIDDLAEAMERFDGLVKFVALIISRKMEYSLKRKKIIRDVWKDRALADCIWNLDGIRFVLKDGAYTPDYVWGRANKDILLSLGVDDDYLAQLAAEIGG